MLKSYFGKPGAVNAHVVGLGEPNRSCWATGNCSVLKLCTTKIGIVHDVCLSTLKFVFNGFYEYLQ